MAHDPGLSGLDLEFENGHVSVQLALSTSDIALLAPDGDARTAMVALGRTAIRLSTVGGAALSPSSVDFAADKSGAFVKLSYPLDQSGHPLTVVSDVPVRMLRGHRQLLVAKAGGRVVTEKMLDAWTGPVTIAFEPLEPSSIADRQSVVVLLVLFVTPFLAATIRRLTPHAW
jgi:hypothetical protein